MARIVVVDDNEAVRYTLRVVLEANSHEVVEAADGEAGCQLLKELDTNLGIVDLWMPGVDGLDLLKCVREMRSDLPIVVISGGGPHPPLEQKIAQAEIHGADAVLIKPFENDELISIIDQLLKE